MRIPSWLSSLARLSDSLSGPPPLSRFRRLKPARRRSQTWAFVAIESLEDRSLLTAPFAAQDWFMTMHDTAIVASTPGVLMNDMAYGGYNPTTMTYTPPGPLTARASAHSSALQIKSYNERNDVRRRLFCGRFL